MYKSIDEASNKLLSQCDMKEVYLNSLIAGREISSKCKGE